MGFFEKLFGKSQIKEVDKPITDTEIEQPISEKTIVKPKKQRKPKVKKVENESVSEPQPEVRVLKFDFDPANPQIGSMELDWNAEFIEMLRVAGYRGVNPEALVDAWLNDVARNILNSSPQNIQNIDGTRYVSRRDIGDGRSEIS